MNRNTFEGTQTLDITQKGKIMCGSILGSSKPKPRSSSSTSSTLDGDMQKTKRWNYS